MKKIQGTRSQWDPWSRLQDFGGDLVDVFIMESHNGIPVDLLDAIWVPIGKVPYPTTMKHIRDLELPHEDRKP